MRLLVRVSTPPQIGDEVRRVDRVVLGAVLGLHTEPQIFGLRKREKWRPPPPMPGSDPANLADRRGPQRRMRQYRNQGPHHPTGAGDTSDVLHGAEP